MSIVFYWSPFSSASPIACALAELQVPHERVKAVSYTHLDVYKRQGFAAAALAACPPSIRRALAIPANNATGTIKDVEHVIILMQENRSFDHYFGTLKGVRGFGDRFPIPLANGRKVWQQQRSNGAVLTPFHIDGTTNNAQRASGTPHSWDDSQKAWDLSLIHI